MLRIVSSVLWERGRHVAHSLSLSSIPVSLLVDSSHPGLIPVSLLGKNLLLLPAPCSRFTVG